MVEWKELMMVEHLVVLMEWKWVELWELDLVELKELLRVVHLARHLADKMADMKVE